MRQNKTNNLLHLIIVLISIIVAMYCVYVIINKDKQSCNKYEFYVQETKQCVPFRNDEQLNK